MLEDIQDKYDKIPENKRQQLVDAYEPCIEVLEELDKLLVHYNSLDTKTKRTWDRVTWDPEKTRTLRARLSSAVVMLNTFYTGLIHDNQVLILEALQRLEKDYKGGHREESITSIEKITSGAIQDDEDDDTAWTQILRDLEDVGVSQQEALGYRDFIVDWLVAAVNQGRLLEQRPEQDGSFSMSEAFGSALPSLHSDTEQTSLCLDVPATSPPLERSHSAPFPPPLPLLSPSRLQNQPDSRHTSIMSLPASTQSSISRSTTPEASETDASSLYAWPQPPNSSTPVVRSSYQIKRVPVPRPPVPQDQISKSATPMSREASLPPVAVLHPFAAQTQQSPTPPMPSWAPPPLPTVAPAAPPPGYYEKGTVTADLDWTAHQIIAAWSRRDFHAAERHLEDQLAAVERGHTVTSGIQPDRRILRHLIGVCASFSGNFTKAKQLFESVFNGIYLNRGNLDEGDIAAARWLGDVCLHLREHQNALLAYSVAYEGSIGRFGLARDSTRRVSGELRLLDHWLFAFRRIEHSFHLNVDPTDIFTSTHAVEKSNLLTSVKARLYEGQSEALPGPPLSQWHNPTFKLGPREKLDLGIAEGFLIGPLISLSTWPLPWDPTFSPRDTVQLDRHMNSLRIVRVPAPLVDRPLPTNPLGDSKNLHYVTKRGSRWLVETVKTALRDLGIEHAEHGHEASIVCCLNQHRDGFAFSEGVEICFRKLQFRNVYGIKITNVKWATRRFTRTLSVETTDFRNLIKSVLENAESDAGSVESNSGDHLPSAGMYAPTPPVRPAEKRPMYG